GPQKSRLAAAVAADPQIELSQARNNVIRLTTFKQYARGAALILATFAVAPASAQDYPTRPVTIVVPFAAGGGTDIIARMLAQKLEQRLGKSFLIDNKPGAGSTIGAAAAARAAPDGYTLLMAPSPAMAMSVSIYKSLPYNPAIDFIPIALAA